MHISLSQGDRLTVVISDSDGSFTVKYGYNDSEKLTVEADMPDSSGRQGIIYEEDFGPSEDDDVDCLSEDEVVDPSYLECIPPTNFGNLDNDPSKLAGAGPSSRELYSGGHTTKSEDASVCCEDPLKEGERPVGASGHYMCCGGMTEEQKTDLVEKHSECLTNKNEGMWRDRDTLSTDAKK